MKAAPDIICEEYADKGAKITIRPLPSDDNVILIEADRVGLEFLGKLLLAQAHYAKDCGFQLVPGGAGKALLSKAATHGLYVHCVHPSPAAQTKQSNGRQRRSIRRVTPRK